MKDLDLINIVIQKTEDLLAQRGFPFIVVQKDQPTQQGIPTQGTVFFEFLFSRYYGHPAQSFEYDPQQDVFSLTEGQMTITTIQFSCLIPQDPRQDALPTAKDVLDYLKRSLASAYIARQFVKSGINIFRVSEVRTNWFEDDNHQFENHPSFDLEVSHSSDVKFDVPAVNRCDPLDVPPYGSGTFPVP